MTVSTHAQLLFAFPCASHYFTWNGPIRYTVAYYLAFKIEIRIIESPAVEAMANFSSLLLLLGVCSFVVQSRSMRCNHNPDGTKVLILLTS